MRMCAAIVVGLTLLAAPFLLYPPLQDYVSDVLMGQSEEQSAETPPALSSVTSREEATDEALSALKDAAVGAIAH